MKPFFLLILLAYTSLNIYANDDKIIKQNEAIHQLNSTVLISYIYQSYISFDLLQRDAYICNCSDSVYMKKMIETTKENYRFISNKVNEYKIFLSEEELQKSDYQVITSLLDYLISDIKLLDIYINSKKEKDYKDFIENHNEFWELLTKTVRNDKQR